MSHHKTEPQRIRYAGAVYRLAQGAHFNSFEKGDGIKFYCYALFTSKTGRNLPGVKEGLTKQRSSVPKELKSELTSEQKVACKEAAQAGILWYLKIDGKGWEWNKRDGAKHVAAVQRCLEFVNKFRNRQTVDDVQCLYCELTNKVGGR